MEQKRTSGWLAVSVALVLLSPLFYVLSIGPAVWVASRNLLPEPVFAVYLPIEWLADESPLVLNVMEAYIDLWDGPDYVPPTNAPLPVPPPLPPPLPGDVDVPFDIGPAT